MVVLHVEEKSKRSFLSLVIRTGKRCLDHGEGGDPDEIDDVIDIQDGSASVMEASSFSNSDSLPVLTFNTNIVMNLELGCVGSTGDNSIVIRIDRDSATWTLPGGCTETTPLPGSDIFKITCPTCQEMMNGPNSADDSRRDPDYDVTDDSSLNDAMSLTSEIARQLAIIGDDVNRRYRTQFDMMNDVISTNVSQHGNIPRFIYRLASDTILSHVVTKTVGSVAKVITSEALSDWLLEQSGYGATIEYLANPAVRLVCTGVVLSALALLALKTAFR